MGTKTADFIGDDEYYITATGDCVVGDEVRFERAVFTGSYRNARFSHYELITGKITKDSYGQEKQQHTFTIEKPDGSVMRIKGRNLYRNGVFRKPWRDEAARVMARDEKHERGAVAREARRERREESFYF